MLSNCANKENPAGLFFWGNLESLNHKNLSEMVNDFWKNNYSASRMTLAVQSKETVHEMVEWIDKLFSEIPTDNQPAPEFKITQEPFCLNLFHNMYKVVSTSSIKKISFVWYLPPVIKLYKFKPLEYISWIIGHEGKGTLISYLRNLNYAMELEAGVDDDFSSNSIYSILTITIELTDLGFKNLNEVIELTFGYLNLIRETGISEDIFKQIQVLAENEFNFAENKTAIDHVKELSERMLIYNEEDYLSGPSLFYEYSPETIQQFLNLLTANRVAIFTLSKEFDTLIQNSNTFTKDDIFGTMYLAESITDEQENIWSAIKPHSFFKLPNENPFLTTQFSILPQTSDIKYPEKIFENEYFELWHKQDSHFKLPKSFVMLNFITQLPSESLENYVLYDLFFDTVVFLLNEETYPAIVALFSYGVQLFHKGFELTFDGFNEKLPLFIDIVIKCLKDYKSLINEEIFSMTKTKCINKYKNKQYDVDYISSDLKNSVIHDPDWCLEERLKCLESLRYTQLLKFYEQLDTFYCRILTQGNINKSQAIKISERVVNILNYKPLPKKCFPVLSIKYLNQGDYRIKMANYNLKDINSMAYKYYQFEKNTIEDSVKYSVLQSMIEEPAFDDLRTKQCLGYDVQFNVTASLEHYGFYFKVAHQKNKFETSYVLDRMNLFLTEFWEKFNDINEFNEVRDALIALKSSPDDCLAQEFDRNKKEIISERFKFNRLEIEIEALKNLKLDDVKNLKDGFLCGRTLSIEIVGNDDTNNCNKNSPPIKKMCFEENKKCIYIQNVNEFKNKLNSSKLIND